RRGRAAVRARVPRGDGDRVHALVPGGALGALAAAARALARGGGARLAAARPLGGGLTGRLHVLARQAAPLRASRVPCPRAAGGPALGRGAGARPGSAFPARAPGAAAPSLCRRP